MRTSCTVSFGSNALAIRDDGEIALLQGGLQPFGDLETLENDTVVSKPYATYEPDFWLLDGNFKFAPDANARGGWVSTGMSAGTGGFDYSGPEPEIYVDFDEVHSTDGLTIYFSEATGDYSDRIFVVFLDAALTLIRQDIYTPTGTTFFTNQPVANFKRIHLEMHSSNRAQRYGRITRIDFDTLTRFTGTDIKSARVVEQINPLSVELPINTIELEIFSADGGFSIVNPTGFYATLQYKEPLDIHADVNGATVYVGRFYLDKWESKSENVATFEASDAIGLLEKKTFIGGIYEELPTPNSEDLIDDIMAAAGLSYSLDSSLDGTAITGMIELYSTCRDALQQVCFLIGAYATCARSSIIQIRPIELAFDLTTYDYTLTSAEKGILSPITLLPLVTGIELHKFQYNISDGVISGEILYSGTLGIGMHTIILGEGSKIPINLTRTGTATYTLLLNRYLYCIINVTIAGTVIISQNEGLTILDTIEGVYNLSLPAGTPENILTIEDAIIVTDALAVGGLNASTVAQRVYDYYAQRYMQKTKLFASLLAPGDTVLVDVQSGRQMKGIVERMETDLAGGYVSDLEIVGVIL